MSTLCNGSHLDGVKDIYIYIAIYVLNQIVLHLKEARNGTVVISLIKKDRYVLHNNVVIQLRMFKNIQSQ